MADLLAAIEQLGPRSYDMHNVDRSLDNGLVQAYLRRLPPQSVWTKLVYHILKNTLYVPFSTFKRELFKCVNLFLRKNQDPYYIIIDCKKYGSDIWLLHLIFPLIRKDPNLKGVVDKDGVLNHNNYLILDDCIYTGSQIVGIIEELSTSSARSFFNIVCPYATRHGMDFINSEAKEKGNDCGFYTAVVLDDRVMNDMYQKLFHTELNTLVPNSYDYNMMMHSIMDKCPIILSYGAYPIYFDHKVAGYFSSYPSIYLEGACFDGDSTKPTDFMGPLFRIQPTRERIEYIRLLHVELLNRQTDGPCDSGDSKKRGLNIFKAHENETSLKN